MLSSYRNQSIDWHSKSINWFLYEGKVTLKVLLKVFVKQRMNILASAVNRKDSKSTLTLKVSEAYSESSPKTKLF